MSVSAYLWARWLIWCTRRDAEAALRLRVRSDARFARASRSLASLEAEISAGRIVLR
jgi:hypothetical protein